ncbi:hypothetical protein DN582_16065, partial [Burkholderia multivorans]
LAAGAFGIGTTEFSPMGLLPVSADSRLPIVKIVISAMSAERRGRRGAAGSRAAVRAHAGP